MSSESREVALPANWRPTMEPGVFVVDGKNDCAEVTRWAKAFYVDDPAAVLAAARDLALRVRKPGLAISFPRVEWQYPTPGSLAVAAGRDAGLVVSPTTSQEDRPR